MPKLCSCDFPMMFLWFPYNFNLLNKWALHKFSPWKWQVPISEDPVGLSIGLEYLKRQGRPKTGSNPKYGKTFEWFFGSLGFIIYLLVLGGFNYSQIHNFDFRMDSNTFRNMFGASTNVTTYGPPWPPYLLQTYFKRYKKH